jgi:hypothetical protein
MGSGKVVEPTQLLTSFTIQHVKDALDTQDGEVVVKLLDSVRHSLHLLDNDEDITTSDTTIPSIELQGPIMRSRAQQLRHQVNSFLCSSANDLENRLLPNDLIVIRNQGVNHREHAGHQESVGEPRKHEQHGGSPSQFRIQEFDFEFNSECRTTLPSN